MEGESVASCGCHAAPEGCGEHELAWCSNACVANTTARVAKKDNNNNNNNNNTTTTTNVLVLICQGMAKDWYRCASAW
jgi:hypothetical protein